jgi:hypothetical protein
MRSQQRLLAVAAPLALACMAVAVCASAAAQDTGPYNPYRLGTDQLTQVEQICQSVMGLSPTEPLVWGIHSGVANLDTWTSHYRGCILSLSASARAVNTERRVDGQAAASSSGPFYRASNRQIADRERLACTELGLEPGSDAHSTCVRNLRLTFFAIDNPIT